jgi:hypothetical protein
MKPKVYILYQRTEMVTIDQIFTVNQKMKEKFFRNKNICVSQGVLDGNLYNVVWDSSLFPIDTMPAVMIKSIDGFVTLSEEAIKTTDENLISMSGFVVDLSQCEIEHV